jgi:hypothetical protein
MSEQLSPAMRQGLALAILLALIGAVYYGVVRPLADTYFEEQDSISQLEMSLARYEQAAAGLSKRQAELAAIKQTESVADGFLQGSNDTLIAAQMQNRIKQSADAAKVDLRTSEVLPNSDEAKLKRIGVREQASGTIRGLLTIFHDLEANSTPMLFLDNVNMRVHPQANRDRNAASQDDIIDVQFDVFGYTHKAG